MVGSAPSDRDSDLGFSNASKNLTDFMDQFEQGTENGRYLTTDDLKHSGMEAPSFSIFHLNIRSLNKHANELVSLLSSIDLVFDCICLTEVHNTNLNHYASLLNGYHFHPVPSQRGNVGGVCIFIKNDIKFNIIDEFTFTCESPCENLWFTLSKNNSETIVGLVYRHPDGSIDEFCGKLETTLEQITQHDYDQSILIGDLNIDLIKYNDSKNKNVKTYVELLVSYGLLPQTILPSRITRQTASLIDHVFLYQRRPSDKIIAGNLITDM